MSNRTLPFITSRFAGKAAVTAAFLTGTIGAGSIAAADEPTAEELLAQIEKLQQQVEKLQDSKADKAQTGESETDAFERVLDDAERRSSGPVFMQDGDDPDPFLAGHNGIFVLRDPEGNFELNPNFQLQTRYVVNINSENGDELEDVDLGWEIRRFKIGFKGHAFSPDLTYDFKFAFGRSGGGAVLQNAFIDYTPATGFFGNESVGIRIGQFKDPSVFEEAVSSSRQMAVDRSIANELLGGGITDFVQGAGLLYKNESGKLKGLVAYIDGPNSDNTSYQNGTDGDAAGVTGRFDLVVVGENDRPFRDFTALGTEQDVARVGAGVNAYWDDGAHVIIASADGSYETGQGLSLFAAGIINNFDNDAGDDGTNFGGVLQAAQVLDQENGWEVFGRYSFVITDDDVTLGTDAEDFFHEVTAGVNKYWEAHKVKATVDVVFLPNGTPDGIGGLGLEASTGADPQVAIRGQFQLLL